MSLLVIAFFSGILSVLAPCVLPVLPVIFGGSGADLHMGKALRILGSALLFIFVFTFLLKVSTAFIGISTQTRASISGVIIILYGYTLVFPTLRERIQAKIPRVSSSSQQESNRGDVLLGASLGPIFTTCSPTYTLLIATILPQSMVQGVLGIFAYLLGFGGFLYCLLRGGRVVIKRFMGFADASGWFKMLLGWILIATGILIITGGMKQIETWMVTHLPSTSSFEQSLIEIIQEEKTLRTNDLSPVQTMHRGYQSYDPNTIPQTGDIVLFFHADRCPTCNEAEKNFLASDIPVGLTILKVNYDKEAELKKKYSILTQTSYVLIKPDGTMIKRWVGGRSIQDIQAKIQEAKNNPSYAVVKTPSLITATAYLAGGCFRCMEGALEALEGVKEVVSGYAGGDKSTASYKLVGRGDTGHREAVKVVYDPALVSFEQILATYRIQIDPTDGGGQFGDRGFQYTPVIYYQNDEEKQSAEASKQRLSESNTFDKPIAVTIELFTSFFPAEEEHQDFYKKESSYYAAYKKGSGRAGFIDEHENKVKNAVQTLGVNEQDLSHLTEQQKDILFNGGTEPPFNNAYRDHKEAGIYVDVIDGTPLFLSTDKFDSGIGWPAFTRPIDEALLEQDDKSYHPMYGTEVSKNDRHLGHVFDDGPTDQGGKRYCINSAALRFVPVAQMNTQQYRKYLVLFK